MHCCVHVQYLCARMCVPSSPVAIPAALGTTDGARGCSCVAIQLPSHGAAWPPKNYLCNIRNRSRPQDCTFSLSLDVSPSRKHYSIEEMLIRRLTDTLKSCVTATLALNLRWHCFNCFTFSFWYQIKTKPLSRWFLTLFLQGHSFHSLSEWHVSWIIRFIFNL